MFGLRNDSVEDLRRVKAEAMAEQRRLADYIRSIDLLLSASSTTAHGQIAHPASTRAKPAPKHRITGNPAKRYTNTGQADMIRKILAEQGPLSVSDLTKQMLAEGYKPTGNTRLATLINSAVWRMVKSGILAREGRLIILVEGREDRDLSDLKQFVEQVAEVQASRKDGIP